MKIVWIISMAACILIGVSCNGTAGSKENSSSSGSLKKDAKIDYKMLENPAEIKRLYAEVLDKLGKDKNKCDEIDFRISRPASEGMLKRTGEPDALSVSVVSQSSKDPKKVFESSYSSKMGWYSAEDKEIQVFGGNAEAFRLEDELFDFSVLTPEILSKVIADGKATIAADKYEYLYVQSVLVKKYGIDVTYHGKLAANAVEKNEYYKAALNGVKQ